MTIRSYTASLLSFFIHTPSSEPDLDSSSDTYRYRPLSNAGTHIRILSLDLDSDELNSSLEVYPIA